MNDTLSGIADICKQNNKGLLLPPFQFLMTNVLAKMGSKPALLFSRSMAI
jgi:hypothetical protein